MYCVVECATGSNRAYIEGRPEYFSLVNTRSPKHICDVQTGHYIANIDRITRDSHNHDIIIVSPIRLLTPSETNALRGAIYDSGRLYGKYDGIMGLLAGLHRTACKVTGEFRFPRGVYRKGSISQIALDIWTELANRFATPKPFELMGAWSKEYLSQIISTIIEKSLKTPIDSVGYEILKLLSHPHSYLQASKELLRNTASTVLVNGNYVYQCYLLKQNILAYDIPQQRLAPLRVMLMDGQRIACPVYAYLGEGASQCLNAKFEITSSTKSTSRYLASIKYPAPILEFPECPNTLQKI